jgi:hypothetical protein
MRSIATLGSTPAGLPLAADDIVEFHAARLLLLLKVCGIKGRIDGLTKLAKLDFFCRYPDFFEVAKAAQSHNASTEPQQTNDHRIESAMVRHHYGPWDKRYYHVLAFLEANQLIEVVKEGRSYRISLTDEGDSRSVQLSSRPSFEPLVLRMRDVKRTFGSKTGNALKTLIYKLFDTEVGSRPLGERIRP